MRESPEAYFDENNRKVLIISKTVDGNSKVQHTIKWTEETDAGVIGKAIEDVLKKVNNPTPRASVGKEDSRSSAKIHSK